MANAENILQKLLKQIAQEQNYVAYDLKIEPISSGAANFTSKIFNVTIKESGNTVYMFAKIAAVGEKMRSQAPKFYETEIFAYTKLSKVYERLQDEQQVADEHRLIFPKFYGCNSALYEETIVLENLVKSGYQAYDRFKTFDLEYAKSALTELGKMHALAFAYGQYYPEEFHQIVEKLKFEWESNNEQLQGYFEGVMTKAVSITREENRGKMQRFVDEFDKEQFPEFYKWQRHPVLGHGDYRPSNLMHKIRDDGTVDIKIVDLQTLQGASPVIDLLYFIFTGSDEEFRARHYEQLLEHYYTQLRAAMIRLHLDPEKVYSKEDFEFELKEKLPFGLTIAIFALPIVTVDEQNAPKVDEDMELSSFSIDKTNDLYVERLNGVINDYVKFGVLK